RVRDVRALPCAPTRRSSDLNAGRGPRSTACDPQGDRDEPKSSGGGVRATLAGPRRTRTDALGGTRPGGSATALDRLGRRRDAATRVAVQRAGHGEGERRVVRYGVQ